MVEKIFDFVDRHPFGCVLASFLIAGMIGLTVGYFAGAQSASMIERLCVETIQQAYDLGPEEGMKLLATVFGVS